MSHTLRNKLQSFEVPPPPSAWNNIAAALDNEFSASDGAVATRLHDLQVQPPAHVWDSISNRLSDESVSEIETTPAAKVFVFRKLAAAAVVAGLVIAAAFYFSNENNPKPHEVVDAARKETPQQPIVHEDPSAPAINGQQHVIAKTKPSRTIKRTPSRSDHIPVTPVTYQPESSESPEQAPLYELSTVAALQPVSVTAPPIRDNNGNLILDLSTIRNGDDSYITVTGPNGKQTKISNKFLSCLGYMNASLSTDNLDAKGARCSLQFEEWRNRLLTESGFIPTANNFFDIFELKDLLQEM